MKKLIVIFCIINISMNVIAQRAVRIGNMEIIVRAAEQDTTVQINVLDEPVVPQVSENTTQPRNRFLYRNNNGPFVDLGFVLPDNSSDYYTVLGSRSLNVNVGAMRNHHFAPRFALVGTLHYSYHNFDFHNITDDPVFLSVVLGDRDFSNEQIRRQTFRSHNLGTGASIRFYFNKPTHRRIPPSGIFFETGARAEVALRKFAMIDTKSDGSKKYHDDHAFNPFIVSAFASVGLNKTAIFVSYRLTDVFNSSVLQKDLPPINIGIRLLTL